MPILHNHCLFSTLDCKGLLSPLLFAPLPLILLLYPRLSSERSEVEKTSPSPATPLNPGAVLGCSLKGIPRACSVGLRDFRDAWEAPANRKLDSRKC